MSSKQKSVFLLSVLLIFLVVWIFSLDFSTQATAKVTDPPTFSNLEPLRFNTTQALHHYFKSQNYQWPIDNKAQIPKETLLVLPQDLQQIKDIKLRKSLFIRIMLPIIHAELTNVQIMRETIRAKLNRTGENAVGHQWFNKLLKEYNVKEKSFIAQRKELLSRIDELPTTLILAQAAIESGWGTSRFAVEGNSLFGQWTFNQNGGITPEKRAAGKSHQVKAFDSLQESVRSYLKNINRNRAYRELREKRKLMRENDQILDAFLLAEGLHRYSEKGKAYVVSINQILNSSEFKAIQQLEQQTLHN